MSGGGQQSDVPKIQLISSTPEPAQDEPGAKAPDVPVEAAPAAAPSLKPSGQLKPPGELKPPGNLTLKKPTTIELKPPGEGGAPKLQPPSASGGGLSLKPPQPAVGAQAPETLSVALDEGIVAAANTATAVSLKKPGEAAAESRLSEPGDLTLKKPADELSDDTALPPATLTAPPPPAGESAPKTEGGLQLRKPSEVAPSEPDDFDDSAISLKLTPPEGAGDPGEATGLTLRQSKQSEDEEALEGEDAVAEPEKKSPGGLTLRKPSGPPPGPPPGAIPGMPIGLDMAPPPAAPPSDDAPPPVDDDVGDQEDPGADAGAPPAPPGVDTIEQISFAPKQKQGLSKQAKMNILIFTTPVVIACVFGAIFVKNLMGTKAKEATLIDTGEPRVQTSLVTKSDEVAADEVAEGEFEEVVEEEQEILFPDELLQQLTAEYGEEAKTVFLNEWASLSNEDRKNYLKEIGAWEEPTVDDPAPQATDPAGEPDGAEGTNETNE